MRTMAELIFLQMVPYTKQPISIVDQMSVLKSRGLLFADKSLFSNTTIFYKCLANIKDELKSLLTRYSIVDVAAMGFPKLW